MTTATTELYCTCGAIFPGPAEIANDPTEIEARCPECVEAREVARERRWDHLLGLVDQGRLTLADALELRGNV